MLYVVSYDIQDDRQRLRVAKILKDYGRRVQLSVFEIHSDAHEMEKIVLRLAPMLDEQTDSLRVHPLCAACQDRIQVIGQGEVVQDPDFIII